MRKHYRDDPEWADEVVRRWGRRRWRVQQREKARADLEAALLPMVQWIHRQLRKWPALYRWLGG